MTYQLNTNNIKVFPSVQREEVESRKLTEARIVGLINKLINQNGFVVNPDQDTIVSGSFQFNIHGYYFEIPDVTPLLQEFQNYSEVWAYITLKDLSSSSDPDYKVLNGSDTNNLYDGIIFTNSEPVSDYKLQLLYKSSGTWYIPDDSKLSFGGNTTTVDGGDVSEEEVTTYLWSDGTFTNCTIGNHASTIKSNETVTVTITPDTGYKLPIGKISVYNATLVSYNNYIATITNPTGDVVISAEAELDVPTVYSITYGTFENCSYQSEAPTSITEGTTVALTISVNSGFQLLESSVIVNGATKSYNAETKVLSISNPTKNVTVSARATAIVETYTISNTLSGCTTSSSTTWVYKNESYEATITPISGYKFGSASLCTVKIGAETKSEYVTYDSTNDKFTINIPAVTGNVYISASASEDTSVTINLKPSISDVYSITTVPASPKTTDTSIQVTITTSNKNEYPLPKSLLNSDISGATISNFTISSDETTIEFNLTGLSKTINIFIGDSLNHDIQNCTLSPNWKVLPRHSAFSTVATVNEGYCVSTDINHLRLENIEEDDYLIVVNAGYTTATFTCLADSGIPKIYFRPVAKTTEHTLTITGVNVTIDSPITIWEGQTKSVSYSLASTALEDTEVLTPTTYATLDKENKIITFANVLSDVSYTLSATTTEKVAITYTKNPSAGIEITGATEIAKNSTLTATILAKEGYRTLTVSDITITPTQSFEYTDGTLTVSNVANDITVAVTTEILTYTITWVGNNVTPASASATGIAYDASTTFTYTLNTGYQSGSYVLDPTTAGTVTEGTNSITISNITSNATLTYTASQRASHSINYSQVGTGCTKWADASHTTSAPTTIFDGDNIDIYFVANTYYSLPDTVTVMGEHTSDAWDKTTGKLSITNVTDDIAIILTPVETTYTITLSADAHSTISPSTITCKMATASSWEATYTIASGYHYVANPTITSGTCTIAHDEANQKFIITNVTSNCSLAFAVEQDTGTTRTITTSGNVYCSADASSKTCQDGGAITFTYTSNTGYNILNGKLTIGSEIFDLSTKKSISNSKWIIPSFTTNSGLNIEITDTSSSNWSIVTVQISNISANYTLSVEAVETLTYTISTPTLTNCSCETGKEIPTSISTVDVIETIIIADDGYIFPSSAS